MHAMIFWICGLKLSQPLPTEDLRKKLSIYDIAGGAAFVYKATCTAKMIQCDQNGSLA